MGTKRTKDYQRNEFLEELLTSLNTDLWISENNIVSNYSDEPMKFPLILIMGPLRSGTTLLTQWLANTGLIAYPSNLLSRFYNAPIIGAKIQLLLTDPRYNFRDELGEFLQQCDYRSSNGKTTGALSPNEFWYFWRRFLSVPTQDVWTDTELLHSMDIRTLKGELNGTMDVFHKPFAAKGMLFNYNIPFLDSIFEKILFIQVKRDPVSNTASILSARKRQLGSEKEWYSFKIPEYDRLKYLEPTEQAAGQVYYINKAVEHGLSSVDESRKLVIQYEDFCKNPNDIFIQLMNKLKMPLTEYNGHESFKVTNNSDTRAQEKIKNAYHSFINSDNT